LYAVQKSILHLKIAQMSALFEIRIQKIEGTTVEAKVISIHPDSGPAPTHPNFMLQMITEVYWLMKKGYLWDLGISEEEAQKFLEESPYQRQLDDWLILSNGWEEPITEEEYNEVSGMDYEERKDHPRYGKLSGWGMSNGQHHLHHRADYAGFVRLSELMIPEVEEPEEGLFVFKVLEEGMLAHMRAGFSWETAAFDFRYA
jgi:hypothetical protein